MKNNSALQAEELNRNETGALIPDGGHGGVRPIRKRAYHRARRAGKTWALVEAQSKTLINSIWKDYVNGIYDSMIFGKSYIYARWTEPAQKLQFSRVPVLPEAVFPKYITGVWVDDVVEKVCECGKDKHGFASHSVWCPKHGT